MNTFPQRPDVFDLILDLDSSKDLRLHRLITPFGTTDTRALTYRETPIAVVYDLMPYHTRFGSFPRRSKVAALAPALRDSEPFAFPTPSSFEVALRALLVEIPKWTIVCERDCDQEPLHFLEADTPEADRTLDQLFSFLRGAGCSTCPTFVATKGEPADASNHSPRVTPAADAPVAPRCDGR